jgi:hypothetical protein
VRVGGPADDFTDHDFVPLDDATGHGSPVGDLLFAMTVRIRRFPCAELFGSPVDAAAVAGVEGDDGEFSTADV